MQPFDYLLILGGIVLALAIADLALSLHRLLRAGPRVRWDWMAPLAAVTVVVKIVSHWWTWYGLKAFAGAVPFEMFLLILGMAVVLFLLASAALPDELGEGEVDLRAYFAATDRYFFGLFGLHILAGMALALWGSALAGRVPGGGLWMFTGVSVALAAVCVSAMAVRRRWWQGLCLLALLAFYVLKSAGHTLT